MGQRRYGDRANFSGELREMKMQPALERALRRKSLLGA
jgi:hypothetical protein